MLVQLEKRSSNGIKNLEFLFSGIFVNSLTVNNYVIIIYNY